VFASKNLAELFPTLVWIFDLEPGEAARCNERLLQHLDSIASPRPEPKNDLSLQSEHDLQRHACFAPLKPKVDLAVRDVMAHLGLQEAEFAVTGAWLNLSASGLRHHEHTHPNNWLSLVYYVQVPAGGDSIRFYDPRPQAHVLMPRTKRPSPLTASSITLGVAPGRLMAFPSWLRHSVDPNAGEGERVSVAINVMFTQFGERMAAPMWDAKLKGKG
jgi:uncharacterized protein (TIGR02466 family)